MLLNKRIEIFVNKTFFRLLFSTLNRAIISIFSLSRRTDSSLFTSNNILIV